MYRPSEAAQMTTTMLLQLPTTTKVSGVNKKTYVDRDVVTCNFKTFGGTEKLVDGLIAVEDTAQITCWYNPNIKSNCRLKRASDGAVFEILGVPENIDMRNQFMRFKIRRVTGGA